MIKEDKEPKVIKDYARYREVVDDSPKSSNEKDEAINYIEENYPETAKEVQRLQFEQYALFCKKQMDYGPSNIAMGTDLTTMNKRD